MYSLVLLIPFSILLAACSVIYFYIFRRRGEKELEFFGFAWLVYALSLIFLILYLASGKVLFLELRKMADMFNILLLMIGMYRFIHLRVPAYWNRFSIYMILLSVICMLYGFELICFYLPITLFQTAITCVICIQVKRSSLLGNAEKIILSAAFLLWGIGNAVSSIFELYVHDRFPVYMAQLVLFTILNLCMLSVYVQIAAADGRKKSSLLENVVNSLHEIVFFYELQPRTRCLYISPSVESLTGYSQNTFYSDPMFLIDIFEAKDIDTIRDLLGGTVSAGSSPILRVIPKTGDPFWCQLNCAVTNDSSGRPCTIECELQNIDEIQSAQLAQVREKEERNKLLSYVSHELRTPITSIAGYTTAVKDGVFKTNEEISEAIDVISDKTATMKTLIDDLSQLSKFDTNQFSFDFMVMPVRELAEYLAAKHLPDIRKDGYIGKVSGIASLPEDVSVICDEERISQVVSNLVSNAVKYSVPGTYITTSFSISEKEGALHISVSDEGPGISADDSRHLFERFYRSKDSRMTRSGRGLGLTLSKEIIEAHKGRIWVYNNKLRGATFAFSIPLYKEN